MEFGGSVNSNSPCGHNVNVHLAERIGNPNVNAAAGVFAAGNTHKGPVTTGAFAELNANGHGLAMKHAHTPGVGSVTSESARLNVFKSDQHAIDANAFHSRTQMTNGLKFDSVGGGVGWNSAQGHAASIGATHIPKFNMTTMDAAAKANIWQSPSGASSFDLTGNATRHLSGPFAGKNNFGAGMGFTHRF